MCAIASSQNAPEICSATADAMPSTVMAARQGRRSMLRTTISADASQRRARPRRSTSVGLNSGGALGCIACAGDRRTTERMAPKAPSEAPSVTTSTDTPTTQGTVW